MQQVNDIIRGRKVGASNTPLFLTESNFNRGETGMASQTISKICSMPDCVKPVLARGWCTAHYQRWRNNGNPETLTGRWKLSAAERLWANVNKTETCWLWIASTCGGYGKLRVNGPSVFAHRFAYELLVGPIPEGLELDHLCRVRHCVNPEHLEPVTHQENMRRGQWKEKTYCVRGHVYSGDNLAWMYRSNGKRNRFCRECKRESDRRRRSKK